MPNPLPLPSPLAELLDAPAEGRNAVLLEGNTGDRVVSTSAGLPRPMNVESAAYETFGTRGYACGRLSLVEGFRPIAAPGSKVKDSPFPVPTGAPHLDPAGYFAQLVPTLLSQKHVFLFVTAIDLIVPDGDTAVLSPDQLRFTNALIEVAASDTFRASGNVLVLGAVQGAANAALRRSGAFRRIVVSLPQEEMRLEFVEFLRHHVKFGPTLSQNISSEELARSSNGCRLIDIEGLARKCAAKGTTITLEAIATVKAQAIADLSHGQLAVLPSKRTLDDIVGSEHLKHFASYQKALARVGSPAMPNIVILMGVPGVGKSYFASAYANHLGRPLLQWKSPRSKWVGESEARTEEALRLIRENAPCVVFVDECDQLLGGRSTNAGDGGVDARIFGSILAETGNSESRGSVQWLLASNRPDLLDVALLDRAGARVVVLTPPARDRALLIAHIAGELGRTASPDVIFTKLASDPKLGMASVRDLFEVVSVAGRHADTEAGEIGVPLARRHLERSIREFTAGDSLETEFIALTALRHIRFSEGLPWIGPDGGRLEGVEIPPYAEAVVDPATGYLDGLKLAARLRQVEAQRRAAQLAK
jgi:SpoVK/Ycf46/Vps4 family AAA+-type ATPase